MEPFSLEMLLVVIIAAIIAMVIRLADYPSELFDKTQMMKFAQAFAASFIAAFLGGWLLITQGMDLMTFMPFLIVVSMAIGGMSTVRALLETAEAIRPGK